MADAKGMLPIKETVIWFPSTAGVSLVNVMKKSATGRRYFIVM